MNIRPFALALVALAMPLAMPLAAQDRGPFLVEQSGRSFYRLDDAVRSGGGGEVSIRVAPGTYKDCASVEGGFFTLRAAQPGTVVFDGGACEGKATLVLRSEQARIEGVIFQNIRVPDRNGAGIRLEKGDLIVANAIFRNSEQGILTANENVGEIAVDRSTFSGLGGCPNGSCSHSLYIGVCNKLTVTRSRFERGTGGHYVKTRAATVDIRDSSFDDTRGRATNYMIDLSAGAVGTISGNVFVQGQNKENYSAFIAVAPEARDNPSAGLVVAGNDAALAPGVDRNTVFVADWSREPLKLGQNRLGPGLKAFEIR
jgi:hypothetical protein